MSTACYTANTFTRSPSGMSSGRPGRSPHLWNLRDPGILLTVVSLEAGMTIVDEAVLARVPKDGLMRDMEDESVSGSRQYSCLLST